MAAKLAFLLLLGVCAPAAQGVCSAEEMDLCDDDTNLDGAAQPSPELSLLPNDDTNVDGATRPRVVLALLPMLVAPLLNGGDVKLSAMFALPLVGLLPMASAGSLTTCGDLKSLYKTESCCGKPKQKLTAAAVAPAAACPYDFTKPACAMAEPQAPRDLTSGAPGKMIPKAIVLTESQAARLPQVNVHFHLGAEHKSEDYQDPTDADKYDAKRQGGRRLAKGPVRPGFMCSTSDLNSTQMAPYTFQYCKGEIQVGKSYEVHYVHSSAGYADEDIANSGDIDGIDDGLGLAAHGRGQLNPMVVVQGQVYQIVQGAPPVDDLLHGWTVVGHAESVMYAGSTTGPSHDNSVCSPYAISWHVDKMCHRVPPESFDNLCKQMKENYNMEADLYPHGSRKILIPDWVVKPEFVKPLV